MTAKEWKVGDICWVLRDDKPVRCRLLTHSIYGWKIHSLYGEYETQVRTSKLFASKRLLMLDWAENTK